MQLCCHRQGQMEETGVKWRKRAEVLTGEKEKEKRSDWLLYFCYTIALSSQIEYCVSGTFSNKQEDIYRAVTAIPKRSKLAFPLRLPFPSTVSHNFGAAWSIS